MTRVMLLYQPVDGGVARHVSDLFWGLRDERYEVFLCGPAVPRASSLAAAGGTDEAHVPLALRRAVAPAADLAGLRRYAWIVRRVRPDLIHAHSSKAGAIARLGRLLRPDIPVLYTPHGFAFAGFFEHELERLAYRHAEHALARLTSLAIAVCAAEGRLAASVGLAGRVRVVHNGIDLEPDGVADQAVLELAKRGPVLCTLTQLRPGKGVETLIDSLPAVVARHPSVQLAIVGDGPSRELLVQRVRVLGIGHAVSFLGERADPRAVLRAADIFVLTSWAESFPYVILEAMSAGLPIVSSDVGGISEAIVPGDTGLLVPRGNHDAASRALIKLLDDATLRTRLGEAAREAVALRFTRTSMIDGVARAYQEALAAARPRRRLNG